MTGGIPHHQAPWWALPGLPLPPTISCCSKTSFEPPDRKYFAPADVVAQRPCPPIISGFTRNFRVAPARGANLHFSPPRSGPPPIPPCPFRGLALRSETSAALPSYGLFACAGNLVHIRSPAAITAYHYNTAATPTRSPGNVKNCRCDGPQADLVQRMGLATSLSQTSLPSLPLPIPFFPFETTGLPEWPHTVGINLGEPLPKEAFHQQRGRSTRPQSKQVTVRLRCYRRRGGSFFCASSVKAGRAVPSKRKEGWVGPRPRSGRRPPRSRTSATDASACRSPSGQVWLEWKPWTHRPLRSPPGRRRSSKNLGPITRRDSSEQRFGRRS